MDRKEIHNRMQELLVMQPETLRKLSIQMGLHRNTVVGFMNDPFHSDLRTVLKVAHWIQHKELILGLKQTQIDRSFEEVYGYE